MTTGKTTEGQTMTYKMLSRKLNIEEHETPLQPGGKLKCSERVGISCSTC